MMIIGLFDLGQDQLESILCDGKDHCLDGFCSFGFYQARKYAVQSYHSRQFSSQFTWSSLVEGGEQLDGPKSQTTMEFFQACVI